MQRLLSPSPPQENADTLMNDTLMKIPFHPRAFIFAFALFAIAPNFQTAEAAVVAVPPSGTYSAPDNQVGGKQEAQQVASNAAGTKDKVLVLTPKSTSDKTFTVFVYNAATGAPIDSVEYSPGNTPPIVLPPGSKAVVQDDPDSDQKKPEGTSTLT